MALGTKDVDVSASGGGVPKTLQPGNHMCTLHKVELSNYTKMAKDKNGYYVMLHLEGPDLGPDFEGFWIDKENESLGRHKGQVAKVKTHNWPYADGKTKGGTPVNRDLDIMKDIRRLCIAYGCEDWFLAQDNKHETIEAFVDEFNKTCPLVGKQLNFCITGREYYSQDGAYKNWDLTLAKYTNNKYPYEAITVPKDDSKLIKFNPDEHVERAEQPEQREFAGDIDDGTAAVAGGAEVDEEFEV